MSGPDVPDTLRALRALAQDPDVTPAWREVAQIAATQIAEGRANARIVRAARLVSAHWADPKVQADLWLTFAENEMGGDRAAAARRRGIGLALNSLRAQVDEADAAALKAGPDEGPGARP